MEKRPQAASPSQNTLLMDIPAEPGSYVLRFTLAKPARVAIGRLGAFDFPRGDYFYLGSAHGPGGLRARLSHHTRVAERPHWHLDFLRPYLALAGGWLSTAPGPLECAWSQALLRLPRAVVPAKGFGAADCRSGCAAHLVAFPGGADCAAVEAALREEAGGESVRAFSSLGPENPAFGLEGKVSQEPGIER